MAGTQQWLSELAIAGFRQLEETMVAPFAATLESLQDDADLIGLSALLTGFHDELLRSMPASRFPTSRLPLGRSLVCGVRPDPGLARNGRLPGSRGDSDTPGARRTIS